MSRKELKTAADFDTKYRSVREHVQAISGRVGKAIKRKYMRGQREHGGELWRKPCAYRAYEEALDLIVYLDVVQEHLESIGLIATKALSGKIPRERALQMIYNIVMMGNASGVPEPDSCDILIQAS